MKKFSVMITVRTQYLLVDVIAEKEQEAKDKAVELFGDSENEELEEYHHDSYISSVEVFDTENIF